MATSPSERPGATPEEVAAIVAVLALVEAGPPVIPAAQPLHRWRSSGRLDSWRPSGRWPAPVDEGDDNLWDRR